MDGAESPREWDRDRDRDEDEYDASERRRHRSSKPRKRSSSSFADDVPPPSLPLPPPPPPPPPPDEWPRRRSSSSSGRRKSDAADVEDDDAVAAAEEEERTAEERSRRTASTATFSSDFRRAPPTRASKMDDAIRNDSKSRRWDDVEPLRLMDGPADLERFGRKDASARERDFDARDFDPSFEDLASRGRSRVSEVLQDESKAPRGGGGGGGGRRMEDSERRIKGKGRAEVAEDDLYMKGKSEEKKYRVRELFDGMPEDINSSVGQRQGFKDDRHRGGGRDYGYGAGWDEAQSSDVQAHEDGVDRERERGRMKDRRDVAWDEDDVGRGGRGRSGRGMRSRSSRKRSWSPLDKKRSRRDSEEFDRDYSDDRAESDTERSIGMKGRDREREGAYCRDDRMERGRDWEGSKEHWKNRHHDSRHEKDLKDEDRDYEFDRDWEIHGRERDRTERDKMQRGGLERKDKGRLDNMKNIAGFGPPGEYGRSESASGFLSNRRNDSGGSMDFDGNWGFPSEDRGRINDAYLAEPHDRYEDDPSQGLEHGFGINSGRALDGADCNMHGGRARMHKVPINNRGGRGGGPIGSGGQSPTFRNSNQGSGSFTRGMQQQGGKGGRGGRGGRGRVTARDSQRGGIPPLPMMGPGPGPGPGPAPGVPGIGPPFGHLGLPPAALQSMGPGMGPSPGPPMGHAGMFPHYPAPLVWGPGRGGGEMNMLPLPHGLSPVPPPGPSGPRFPPNMGPAPNQGVYFNQPGPSRVTSPGIAGTGYGPANPIGRPIVNDKPSSGRVVPRMTGPPGKAPSRGEQNDYSQNFVDTGMRPQNFIRELELANVVEDYPKLRELIQKKDEIVAKTASPPMYLKCDLKETSLSSELFGTKFDVILVDPPWEEYVQRAPGVGDHMEYWTPQEIQNLKIEAIAENPSFIFLWVGSGDGLEHGRACLKKWGFRRCEDICWVKTNKSNPSPGLRHDSFTIFQRSKEHCLMGIKGTVRRSTDGHIIHANIDTDIIIAEEPPHGSTTKPEDLYRIVEHFALGRRRLELFGEDHNIRAGWLTVGKGLTSSNFNAESYAKNFVDKDGKLWQGGAGRNPPPDAPHLVGTTPEIESLRPKSPPPKSQQQQQQATSVSQPAANSTNKKSSATSPSHPQKSQASSAATLVTVAGITQEIQATSAPGTTLSVPEISRNMTFTSIEQKSVTIQSSISKVPNIGSSRVGSDGENAVEDLFLDTGTGGGTM